MPGAPTKYKSSYNKQAFKLCLLGATDKELADFFEVVEDTINEWKNVHPQFSVSIKKGKLLADTVIANSLYERAKGCKVVTQEAVKLTCKEPNERGKIMQTETVEIVNLVQELPPDTTAMIFWLKNRHPKLWRDKQEVGLTDKDGNDAWNVTLNLNA